GENVRAEIGKIVAIDGCDNGVLEVHLGYRLRDARRLGDVVRGRTSVGDGAISAIAGAHIAEDHEGGGAVLPALADIGAVSFLTDGMEVELAHQLLEPQVIRTT